VSKTDEKPGFYSSSRQNIFLKGNSYIEQKTQKLIGFTHLFTHQIKHHPINSNY